MSYNILGIFIQDTGSNGYLYDVWNKSFFYLNRRDYEPNDIEHQNWYKQTKSKRFYIKHKDLCKFENSFLTREELLLFIEQAVNIFDRSSDLYVEMVVFSKYVDKEKTIYILTTDLSLR